jgi:hypothetical protein
MLLENKKNVITNAMEGELACQDDLSPELMSAVTKHGVVDVMKDLQRMVADNPDMFPPNSAQLKLVQNDIAICEVFISATNFQSLCSLRN